VNWKRLEGTDDYRVDGVGGAFPVKYANLFLGNAGTAFRSLTAACAFAHGDYTLSGVPRMHERPIGDLVDALCQAGALIDYTENDGFPPLHIMPPEPVEGEIGVKGNVSSQFLTGLLLAAPLLGREVVIRVEGELISKPYVEITLNLMKRYGVEVVREGWQRFTVPVATYRSPTEILVEGDASSASYFLAAGAIGHGPVRVQGVGPQQHPGRRALRRGPGQDGCRGGLRPGCVGRVDRMSPGLRRQTARHRPGLQPHPRCRHDPGGAGPVRQRHHDHVQHRQLARQGNRPHRRHGHGIT
jgi:3-phosphoshikimate 1-carboxyvinyltransferase